MTKIGLVISCFFMADPDKHEVKCLEADLSPISQVQLATECLPTYSEKKPSFCRWTIMDYHRAYTSGDTTPLKVSHYCVHIVELKLL